MPETGVKISLLPSATNPTDNDALAGVAGSTTSKFYLSVLKEYLGASLVPNTRKVNGKALSADITLTAEDVGAAPDLGTITLSTTWSGSGPYSQTVVVSGATVTANSKVDIQLTAAQIASLISAGVTGLVIENNAGTLTAYAVGATPSASMTVQVTVTEVAA